MAKLVWNILDLLKKYGDEAVSDFVSDFSCEKMIDGELRNLNPDIEHFIKVNAIQFARQKKSVTYIVGDSDDGAILVILQLLINQLTFRRQVSAGQH